MKNLKDIMSKELHRKSRASIFVLTIFLMAIALYSLVITGCGGSGGASIDSDNLATGAKIDNINKNRNTIIFQTNFDKCGDWTIAQTSSNKSNYPATWPYGQTDFPCGVNAGSGTGAHWVAWYDSKTYIVNNAHNTVILSTANARSGKGITHYTEVPTTASGGEASDGSLGISLTTAIGDPSQGYDEIWITVWRKFDSVTPYYTAQNMNKFIRVSSYDASKGSIGEWFSDRHLPFVIHQTNGANSTDNYGYKLRYHQNMVRLYPNENRTDYVFSESSLVDGIFKASTDPTYIGVYAKLQSGTQHGGWQQPGNYGDGNYYCHEYHLKMNSAPGKKNGVYEYYINGIRQWSVTDIPWVKAGANMVKWNYVVFGGNNDYYNSAGEYETWYAYDDIVISTYRVGSTYTIPSASQVESTGTTTSTTQVGNTGTIPSDYYALNYYTVTGAGQFLATDSQSYPALVGTYRDVYGTTVKRMTDEAGVVRPNYTARTSTIENLDGTLFAVNSSARSGSSWEIFTVADGTYRASLSSFVVNGDSAYDHFVWSSTQPYVGYLFAASKRNNFATYPAKFWKITINPSTYAVSGSLLYTYSVSDMPACPVGETINFVKNHDEGPPSWDGRYWSTALQCSGDTNENFSYAIMLLDRDLNGFESPGVKGYVILPPRQTLNTGVSPGGGYWYWRQYQYATTCPDCCGFDGACVKYFPVASVSGNMSYVDSTQLNNSNCGIHHHVQYDDLGNEIYVTLNAGSAMAYWKFNDPGSKVIPAHWSLLRLSEYGTGFGDRHAIPAGTTVGPRSWIAFLPTSKASSSDECGYENTGTSTITYVHASATNPKVFRVNHARNEAANYSGELFAGSSRDGTKMYFQSNWCGTQTTQLFRVELPSNWWTEIFK